MLDTIKHFVRGAGMDPIDRLRAFNRLHTARLGLLERSYLGSGLGLTEVRALWEVAHAEPLGARTLAARLGVDEGQMSRTLRRLEERGWIARAADEDDRRRVRLAATEAGREALAPLEARSREALAATLSHLPPGDLSRLADLLDEAGMLIGGPAPEVELRDLAPGDAGWIVGRHGALYAAEEGFDATFEALVAEILAGFLRDHDPERERAWIAWTGRRRLGSVMVVDDDGRAKLRLFLLEPDARGRGLGRRLLRTATEWARVRGYREMRLWTHESHRAACALYADEGFACADSRPARSFGRDVVEQVWARDL